MKNKNIILLYIYFIYEIIFHMIIYNNKDPGWTNRNRENLPLGSLFQATSWRSRGLDTGVEAEASKRQEQNINEYNIY